MAWGWDEGRAIIGVAVILLICWLISENKKRFPWRLMAGAMLLQAGLFALFFGFPASRSVLASFNAGIDGLGKATAEGTKFVFGYLGGGAGPYVAADPNQPIFVFAFQVLPLILVISALSAVLWHWKILQYITRGFGFLFARTMGLGGASALATAANIFMGMVESPIVIKAYLDKLSRSELYMMMVVGLATVAGSTMVAYAAILAPFLPNAGAHVLTASILTAPAGILLARIIIPEKDGVDAAALSYDTTLSYDSTMDAITKGVADGIMVVVNIAAFLIVFVAFVAIVNQMMSPLGLVWGSPLTLQRIFGWIFSPLAWLMGIPWAEAGKAGGLLGTKLFLTEFAAYIDLGAMDATALSVRSRTIMTYGLCGFANVGSVGIMTGGLSALMPDRRKEIMELAVKSLLPGFLATCLCACVVAAMPRGIFY